VKACPACGRLYPESAGFCPVDGEGLRSATQVPIQQSDDERVGTLVAQRYQVRRVVADGGMGRVYEALDMQAQQRVAIKMLHSDVASDSVSVERFKREFEVSQQLPHDHIVEVCDFQRDANTYALVMEFLDGEELRTVLKREKTITPGRLIRMMAQTAFGLGPAHNNKLIHRDLKPDNIFLCGTREGDIVKLLDFGSVKDKSESAKKLTVMGTTIGSPYYMAPEQAQGLDSLDHRADVWAMAAIAYECVVGTVPFTGNNGPTILLSILTKEPLPPSIAGKDAAIRVPPAVDDVMEDALSKKPEYRTGSIAELADRLGHAYGLTGNHLEWATTPQPVLDERIKTYLASLPAVSASAPAAVADPFAAGTAVAVPRPQFQDAPTEPSQYRSQQQASGGPALASTYDDVAAGVPTSSLPPWLLPLGIFLAVAVIGVVVGLLVLR
jgi:serine/threonine protein kinase